MSLEKSDVIDLVAILPGSSHVSLIVFDYGEVLEPDAREKALHKKLMTYLQFVVSGQFANTHPEHAGRDLDIKVVCANPPTEGMKRIEMVGNAAHPGTFFPVEVTTDEEFRHALRRGGKPIAAFFRRLRWWGNGNAPSDP